MMLLSLKPRFAARIYDGSKSIELRRVRPCREVARVLIYETSPVKRITGWFTLRWIRLLSPTKAWSRFRRHLGISRRAFRAYFQNCRTAVLLAVSQTRRLAFGVKLSSVRTGMKPPQSYVYLDKNLASTIH